MDVIGRLADFGTPSIANALEAMGESPMAGFTDATVGLLTGDRPFVGRAATATMTSVAPRRPDEQGVATEVYWRYVSDQGGPTIVVVEDLDDEPVGAMFGEVQGRLHQALGVAGIVTNGAVRDLGELGAIGLPVIAGRACVSHAHAWFHAIDVPVTVGGLAIRPGDLLHADRHGVQLIPAAIDLEELARVAAEIESLESELFAATRDGATLDSFLTTWTVVRSRWPSIGAGPDDAI
jgi:regulator of RNase E activity RraA